MGRHLSATFVALRVRPFRILWIGTLFAFVGFFMSMVVQSVVAFDLTGTNRAVGLVVFAQGLMMFTLGPFGGAFADRWPKRRVIAVSQIATMTVFFVLAAALASGAIHLWMLIAGSLVMGSSFAFLGPARQSLAVELVAEEHRGNAIALAQVANSACRVLGPALAAGFLAWRTHGTWVAYAVMGLFYLVSILSLGLLPKSVVPVRPEKKHVLEDVLDGLRYVRDHRRLRTLMLLYTSVIIVGFPHITLLPGFVENQLGRPSDSSSVLFAVSAFGSLVAGLLVARFADSPRAPFIFTMMALLFGVSLLVVAVIPDFLLAVLALAIVGALNGGFQTLAGAVIIHHTEPRYVGRVMSLTMLSFAGFGLMGLPIGYMADAFGERIVLAAMGAVVCLVVLRLRRSVNSVPATGPAGAAED